MACCMDLHHYTKLRRVLFAMNRRHMQVTQAIKYEGRSKSFESNYFAL